jgi:hypothetical protein
MALPNFSGKRQGVPLVVIPGRQYDKLGLMSFDVL